MSNLEPHYMMLLQRVLERDFVALLPPILGKRVQDDQQKRKNLSRAFGAFVVHKLADVSPRDAANSVVDDFDDFGIDAIYFHAQTDIIYIVQSKLKESEPFLQGEALAFCQGVRKLLKQDFNGFNKNVLRRQNEIEDALAKCTSIKLVIAHTGDTISRHAQRVLDELLSDKEHGEERLESKVSVYDSSCIVRDLRAEKAHKSISAELRLQPYRKISEPRITYFGLIPLDDLVRLHVKLGRSLYEKNIRSFLGHKTDVNSAIETTLDRRPQDFFYLNNGVAALCHEITPKEGTSEQKRLIVRGLSIINGAQTIASASRFVSANTERSISSAKVLITLIKIDPNDKFGKSVTYARNHQNPVLVANFAALDDGQERLRRELAQLDITYSYKPGEIDSALGASVIRIDEAMRALAVIQPDPRYVVWLKKDPSQLLSTESPQYKEIFASSVSPFELANAVLLNRYIQQRIQQEVRATNGQECLILKHGSIALAWVLAKRLHSTIKQAKLLAEVQLSASLSKTFDDLRQSHIDSYRRIDSTKGPLAFFRSQTDVVPFLADLMITHFGLQSDSIARQKRNQDQPGQPYPEALFRYLCHKAPKIVGLS